MKARLFFSATSPYARKARIVAIETGISIDLELIAIDVWAEQNEFQRINPLGKVPALVTPDGRCLFDSTVICEHFGRASATAWKWVYSPEMMTRHATAQGIMDAALSIRLEHRFREPHTVSQFWLARWATAISRSLSAFELGRLPDPVKFEFDAVALLCAVSYLSLREDVLKLPFDWRSHFPKTALWHDQVSMRRSVVDTAA